MGKKSWNITAHELITHCWQVEAETEDEANELALEGCPLPDGDCSSVQFDIVSVKEEIEMLRPWTESTFRLEVFLGKWKIVARRLTQERALEESKQYTRFKIVPEREVAS